MQRIIDAERVSGRPILPGHWFEVVEGGQIMQSDVIPGCPILKHAKVPKWPVTAGATLDVKYETHDVVILTQSCDIENGKVEDILVAQLLNWWELVRQE